MILDLLVVVEAMRSSSLFLSEHGVFGIMDIPRTDVAEIRRRMGGRLIDCGIVMSKSVRTMLARLLNVC